jgi:WD40 repeat protein
MGTVQLFAVATGEELPPIALPEERRWSRSILRFAPDGKTLAVTGTGEAESPGPIYLLDRVGGKQPLRVGGQELQGISDFAFSPDGKTMAIASPKFKVQLRETATGKLVRAFGEEAATVAFSPDGKTLALVRPGKLVLVEAATGKERERVEHLHINPLPGLAFTPDGKTLISLCQGGIVHFWDIPRLKERLRRDARSKGTCSLAVSRDGRTVAVGTDNHIIRLWDVATGRELFEKFQGSDGWVRPVAFSQEGRTLLTAWQSGDGVTVWDTSTGQQQRHLNLPGAGIELFSPDGRRVVTSGPGNEVCQIRDIASGRELSRLRKEKSLGPELSVTFSPDGKWLVSKNDQGLHVWDAATGKHLRELTPQPRGPVLLAIAPDSNTLAVGVRNHLWFSTIHLWDIQAGKKVLTFGGEQFLPFEGDELVLPEVTTSLAFSPDGRTLVSGGSTGTVRLWEVATGKEIMALRGEQDQETVVGFSPDGKLIASGSGLDYYTHFWMAPLTTKRKVIRLWDAATGKELQRLQGHGTYVCSLAFSPDGTRLATGLQNATALVWDLTPGILAREERTEVLVPDALETLWVDLAGADAGRGYRAVGKLAAARGQAVRFLRSRLQPAVEGDPVRLRQLLADLESTSFAVREAASKELASLGERAEPTLRRALAGSPTLELRRRIEALLASPRIPPPEVLRAVRAVQGLERIGTPHARRVLQHLASGAPEARLTREAKASLERLARRAVPEP